jgi:phospholipid N-methyltransferase
MLNYYSDFQHFDICAKQTESIVNSIRGLDKVFREGDITLADIGANDGSLTQKVLHSLESRHPNIQAYAFEPDKIAYSHLEKRFAKNKNVKIDNLDFREWINLYAEHLAGTVDLLLNSHTFYHFPRQDWKKIISDGNNLISEEGRHVIIIDSEDTPVNQLKQTLDKKLVGKGTKTAQYGEVLFGSDLIDFFEANRIGYEHKTIMQPLEIPSNEFSLQNFARVLGFLFRYDRDAVLKYSKGPIQEFMKPYDTHENYSFPRTQDVFILGK